MNTNGHKKLRLLKVLVQPVLIEDDGENLTEKTVQPITVPASEWESYPEKMAEQLKKTEAELNDDG